MYFLGNYFFAVIFNNIIFPKGLIKITNERDCALY